MRLPRQCEIAVDLLVFCAMNPNDLVTTRDAGNFANASRDHAHQVAVRLVQAQLLEGVRGRRGGIRLKRQPEKIVIGEVVRLMEPLFMPVVTPLRNVTFNNIVRQAMDAAFEVFNTFTIADLAAQDHSRIDPG